MRPATQFSVVLVTSSQEGLRESGSGFVVSVEAPSAFVLTCAHVIRHWDAKSLQVNGRPAEVVCDGIGHGIDLALLKVTGLDDAPPLSLKEFVRSGATVYGYGFRHLEGDYYVRGRLEGKVRRLLSVQGKSARRSIPAWTVQASKDYPILPGYSGAPLIEAATHGVVGVLSHRHGDGREGIAISPDAVRLFCDQLPGEAARADSEAADGPPAPPPPHDPDDPQRGRFRSARAPRNVRLEARLTESGRNYFYYDLVAAADGAAEIVGPARFFLHDSYPRSVIWVWKRDSPKQISLKDVYSYGVYTVGCQVKARTGRSAAEEWVNLEYDLAKIPRLPKHFLSR